MSPQEALFTRRNKNKITSSFPKPCPSVIMIRNYGGLSGKRNRLLLSRQKTDMQCPKCLYDDTKVLDSRVATDGYSIRRRRECAKCRFRFSTLEQMEILDLMVVKRNGQREPYSKDKLMAGLNRALEKRPITQDNFKKLVASIEQAVSNSTSGSEITSAEIGEIVIRQLKKIDQVAYIRFASVYRQFKGIEEFRKELKKL